MVGDGRSAALVDRAGAVTWLAWPRFDSPSLCAAILDPERGGYLRVAPAGRAVGDRAYLDGTNVLVTRFETGGGALRLLDFMALAGEEDLRRSAFPEHELLRIAQCAGGEVDVVVEADLRPAYGAVRRRFQDRGALGLRLERDTELVTLRSTAPLEVGADGVARGRAHLREGEAVVVSLAYDGEAPAVLPPLGEAEAALRRTARAWRRISSQVSYAGPWRDEVVRSILALELLSYPPTGAIVAAATTSLPERPAGDLNWDYRYCWLRDAALTVRALYGAGCTEAAAPFTGWLLHTTRLTRPELRVLYDVYGQPPERERVVPQLGGHGGAWPVRVGNAAAHQHQLDVYGEVVDAVAQAVRRGARLDREMQAMLRGFGRVVCDRWLVPDAGIWEPRGPPRLRTHSLVLGWVALTRLLELHERGALVRVPVARFARERDAIRRLVDARAFLARANDVGLFAEEIDPRTGAALGNFPQAFTHVGVVNAVLTLDRRVRAERARGSAPAAEARP